MVEGGQVSAKQTFHSYASDCATRSLQLRVGGIDRRTNRGDRRQRASAHFGLEDLRCCLPIRDLLEASYPVHLKRTIRRRQQVAIKENAESRPKRPTCCLPKGVSVELAKDATAVGWVYQYALVDTTGQYSIEKVRSFQDWYLRYDLQSVPGVAEVAPLGGFVRQYQVNIDPNKLLG